MRLDACLAHVQRYALNILQTLEPLRVVADTQRYADAARLLLHTTSCVVDAHLQVNFGVNSAPARLVRHVQRMEGLHFLSDDCKQHALGVNMSINI